MESGAVVPGMAEAIEARRVALGYETIAEMVEVSGLTRPAVDNVRKGLQREYHDKTIRGIARALSWDLDWYDRLATGRSPLELVGGKPAQVERLDRIEAILTQQAERIARLEALLDRDEQ